MVIPQLSRRQKFFFIAGVLFFLAIAITAIARYISPSPPRSLTLSTGAQDGAYHQFGQRYQAYMAKHGIELKLQTSTGSVQNLERLHDERVFIDAGLVQGGLGQLSIDPDQNEDKTPLRSLAVIAYEPVWIFASRRLTEKLALGLGGLAQARVAIGAEGSGTRKVAQDLLGAYGIDVKQENFQATGGMAAAQALIDGKLDAIMMVSAPQGAAVQKLLQTPGIALVNLAQAEGLARRLPYLSVVSLKAGSVEPIKNLPEKDIALLATTANLVVHKNIHPAIAYLLLEAARDTHKSASLLHKLAEFPSAKGVDFPLADEATRYFKDGRPFLQRYLPFWAANAVQRLLLILIPLAAIAIPIIKFIPELWNFRENNRIYRRYGDLMKIETDVRTRQLDGAEIRSAFTELESIEQSINQTKFSLDFSDRVYTLRQHIEFVRHQLQTQQQSKIT